MTDRGVWYIAKNYGSLAFALRSAESVKKHNPDLSISIATDDKSAKQSAMFDNVMIVPAVIDDDWLRDQPSYPHQGYYGKVKYIYDSPYEYTLYMDIDTIVAGEITSIFDVLERGKHDLAIAHSTSKPRNRFTDGVPESYMMFNNGVIAFHKSDKVKDLIQRWWRAFLDLKDPWGDEPMLMQTLFDSPDIRYATLPPEYNFRFNFPRIASSHVSIFHGRSESMSSIISLTNHNSGVLRFCFKDRIAAYDIPTGELKEER